MLGYDFWIQLVVVLIALFYGARKGGMALGLIGGIGLLVLVFGFGVKPGKPPVDVILTILAVVCGSAALQAAGGLDCLLQIAERVLRRHPRAVVYVAPYICWFLTVLCGTGHVVYTMLPIIYDVAIKNNIRPERPMAASTIAAQMGVICSPAAVAAVSMIALLDGYQVGGHPFGFVQLFSIVIPAAIVGLFAECTYSSFRGKDLDKDPEFQKLIREKVRTPLASGERLYTRWQFLNYFKDNSIQLVQPDACNCGGISECRKICTMAEAFDVKAQIHCAGGPISTAAALQLTAATTNFAIYEHHFRSTQPAIARLGKYDYQPVNGKFYVSDRPGIGQELSEAAIAEALVHVTVDEP